MSSYIAEMTIGSNTYKVLDADISYYQHTRGGGMPSSEIQGGTFTVKIESSDGPQYDMLTEWMFGKSIMKEGYIRFYRKDGISRLFDFEFYDAHCVRYHEFFNYSDSNPMTTMLTVSPGITRIQSLVKEMPWKISDLHQTESLISQTAITRDIVNLQWKKDGVMITEAYVDDEVFLTADVINIPDGQNLSFNIFELMEDGREKYVANAKGVVKDGKLEMNWVVKYVYKPPPEDDPESEKLGYIVPEYIFKIVYNGDKKSSDILEIKGWIDLKILDPFTEEPHKNTKFELLIPTGEKVVIQTDEDGCYKRKEPGFGRYRFYSKIIENAGN